MEAHLRFNFSDAHTLLILKYLRSTTHHLVRVGQQLTKHMRTHSEFLLDRLSIFTSSNLGANRLSNYLKRTHLSARNSRKRLCFYSGINTGTSASRHGTSPSFRTT